MTHLEEYRELIRKGEVIAKVPQDKLADALMEEIALL